MFPAKQFFPSCFRILLFFILLYSNSNLLAQGTVADYERAGRVRELMENKIFYAPTQFSWFDNGKKCWYLNRTPQGKEFMIADAVSLRRETAFDHGKAAAGLSQATGKNMTAYQLPFDEIRFTPDGKALQAMLEDNIWQMDLNTYQWQKTIQPAPSDEMRPRGMNRMRDTIPSPDGKWVAFIRDFNIYIQSATDKTIRFAISRDGTAATYYTNALFWSPDSKKIATYRVEATSPRQLYLLESSPIDQLQPKLHQKNYVKPGDPLPEKALMLFFVEERKQQAVPFDLAKSAYSLTNPVWRNDSRSFTIEYDQRGHQLVQVLSIDAATGTMKTLINETSKTFIYYRGKYFRADINDGQEIIWASERDGWNHLYRFDGRTGQLVNQVTKGKWVVRNVIHLDESQQTILFAASGRNTGEDPYHIHYYTIKFDGSGLKELGTENANHSGFFSDDYSVFIDSYSRVDLPSTTVLRSTADGRVLMDLEKADASALVDAGWKVPEVFHTIGRDDSTDIWGIIIRPTNFNPEKKYPVIEYIYAGPHDSFVPKSFISKPASGDYRTWTALNELAELGFIVVQMDGMGTSNRSKAFHDVCWRNLKDAGFPDRIRWIKAAAAKYSYMDTTNVGIYGNSAGGQSSAGALLFHPEFYKVAVSSSGCHDNRMDKISWNEQWMGYPIGPWYAESSNVTHAANLQGKLLLILGELDDNVDPASTLQLVNALIKANKNFDFLMVPGMGHSLGGDYGEHKRRDFFVKNLLRITPPEWNTF